MRQLFKLAFAVCMAATPYVVSAQPANDACTAPTGPLAAPSITSGTTTGATGDVPPAFFCGTSVTAPGVWYTVIGTGNTMTASTCDTTAILRPVAPTTTPRSAFTAHDCADLTCVDGQRRQLFWLVWVLKHQLRPGPPQAGTEYRVLVHGFG